MANLETNRTLGIWNNSYWTLIASGILAASGCCVRVGPHETVTRTQPVAAHSSCACRQAPCSCKTSSVSASVKVKVPGKTLNQTANVAPPAVPALTKVSRPALFSSNKATAPNVQSNSAGKNSRNFAGSFRADSENNPAVIESLPTPKGFEVRPIQESKNASVTRQVDVPVAPELPESEPIIPVTRPSNTLILEIDATENSVPGMFDQSSHLPANVTPKLTAHFGDEVGDSIQTSGTDDPQQSGPSTRTIMFAVPRLSPSNIQSTARIVSIGDPQIAQSSRRPYSLSVVPAHGGSQAKPIAPVLDELRTGRRIELPQAAPMIQR